MEFPIHFKKGSFENWNRQKREFDLLQNIFTEKNFSAFTIYSSFMIKNCTTFTDCNSSAVQEFVRLGDEFYASREFEKAIENYSEALNKPFNPQKTTCTILMKKALCYEKLNQLEKSIGDLENAHELEDIDSSELKLKVRLRLLRAYQEVGHKNNFHVLLEEAVKYMKTTKFLEKTDQKDAEKLIKQSKGFIKGYKTSQSISVTMKNALKLQTKSKEIPSDLKPFQGYSSNQKLPGASIACSLIESKTSHRTKVLANRPIKKSEIVVLNQPFVSEISSPLCEYCHESNSTFFCYKCGYVSYCSNECKTRDHSFHKYECLGYNFFWLNILKVKIELRTLIRCLGFMKKAIFDKFDLSSIKSAEDLVKLLEHHLELNGHFEYSNVYNMDPKYDVMSLNDYKSCATKSLFLTSYIEKHTTLIKDFFHECHNISSQEIKLFLGAIIMKHSAQIKNHKWNIKQSTAPTSESLIFPSTKLAEPFVNTVTPYRIMEFKIVDHERFLEGSLKVKLDENVMEINKFDEKRIQPEKMNFILQNVIDVHNDQIKIEEYIKTNRLEDLLKRNVLILQPTNDDGITFKLPEGLPGSSKAHSGLKGEEFVRLLKEMLEIKKNFPSSNKNNGIFVAHGLYPTLYQFNHSCNPNLVFDVIRPGIIIARASRDIDFGEEITVSLGPHFKLGSTKTRQAFLMDRRFEKCCCSECNADMDSFEHNHNFECKNCGYPIDSSLYYCSRCNNPQVPPIGLFAVKDFLSKYRRSEPKNFNTEFNIHLSILRVLATIYTIDGVYIYDQMLKILKLLVEENLPKDSLILIKLIKDCPEKFYPEMSFPYFNEYLELTKLISEIISVNATDELYGSNAAIIEELVNIANAIASKFDQSNSCKKNEFLFIYESYIKVENLKKSHKLKSCQKSIYTIIDELEEPKIDLPVFELGEIDRAITETYELVFGDFSTEKSHLAEDLFLSELSEESQIEEEKAETVLFPISWNDMIEDEEKSLKMIDKSVVATPSSFKDRNNVPPSLKDLELEDISPDEDSFNFKTPPIKNVPQSSSWRNRSNRDEKRNSSNKKKSKKKNM